MTIRVPNTHNFSLNDVYYAVKDHDLSVSGNLVDCFAKAEDDYFDSRYEGSKDRLSNFRNYGPPRCYVANTFHQTYGSVNAQPQGIWFTATGSNAFVIYNYREVTRYSLSTAWDPSTASYEYLKTLTAGKEYNSLYFTPNGLSFFTINKTDEVLEKWNMTLAYNVSTASLNSSYDFTGEDTGMLCLYFKSDGKKLFMGGNEFTNTAVYEYTLSTGFDLSTVSYVRKLDLMEEHPLIGVWLSSDGKRLYALNQDSNFIVQVNLPTAFSLASTGFNCAGYILGIPYEDSEVVDIYVIEEIEEDLNGKLHVFCCDYTNSAIIYDITQDEPL